MSTERRVNKNLAKKLEEFNKAAALTAEEIIFETFPTKSRLSSDNALRSEFQELIESTQSPSSPFHTSHAATFTDPTVYPPPSAGGSAEPETKKRKLTAEGSVNGASSQGVTASNGIHHAVYPNLVVTNQHLPQVYTVLKTECEALIELCDKVKLWVNLSMPKIEDGDNFGVQIQEGNVTSIRESAYNIRDARRQGHLARAKISSKIIKYPHVEDYTLALKEHDQKQLYIARQNLNDLRNVYAVLTDILHKNIAKIRSPKGNNLSGLY
ncbi:proteasome activator pa28 REG alpha/beta subunit [Wolfiporia cocos MD-104 SS10]|uniref:Proteasome activator pa28 REG alpha/beta subunit n=1 Tax=Wolfiporia cocos (strain MD-104) TaxID=742152 RepID=A0A2H3J2Q1_WOLCO|nr:proteasome activator pa28 REG alpha/beta subunit [Wolfiporia cocos MD-104 SS10]